MIVTCYRYDSATARFEPLAEIDNFASLRFGRSYADIGSFEMTIDKHSANARRIESMTAIRLGAGRAGLVTKMLGESEVDAHTLTVSGRELKYLTNKRIVYPPAGNSHLTYTSAAPEYVIAELIRTQLLEAASERRISGTLLPYTGGTDIMQYEGRYQKLYEEITDAATYYNVGWYADIVQRRLVWQIYRGVDRRYDQRTNNTLILTPARDTVQDRSLARIYTNRTTAVVAGQGEGEERTILVIGDDVTGMERSEVFVDARDTNEASELQARGDEELADQADALVYECTLSQKSRNQYFAQQFGVGDLCTAQDPDYFDNQAFSGRITEAVEVYEAGEAPRVDVTVGYDQAEIQRAFSRALRRVQTVQGAAETSNIEMSSAELQTIWDAN